MVRKSCIGERRKEEEGVREGEEGRVKRLLLVFLAFVLLVD